MPGKAHCSKCICLAVRRSLKLPSVDWTNPRDKSKINFLCSENAAQPQPIRIKADPLSPVTGVTIQSSASCKLNLANPKHLQFQEIPRQRWFWMQITKTAKISSKANPPYPGKVRNFSLVWRRNGFVVVCLAVTIIPVCHSVTTDFLCVKDRFDRKTHTETLHPVSAGKKICCWQNKPRPYTFWCSFLLHSVG